MLRQNLGDLNGYLFESLDALSKPDMTEDETRLEIERARAVTGVSDKIIQAGRLVLDTEKTYQRNEAINAKAPAMLEGNTVEEWSEEDE